MPSEVIISLIEVPFPAVDPVTSDSVLFQEITEPGTLQFIPIETASPEHMLGCANVVTNTGIGLTTMVPLAAGLEQFEPLVYTTE